MRHPIPIVSGIAALALALVSCGDGGPSESPGELRAPPLESGPPAERAPAVSPDLRPEESATEPAAGPWPVEEVVHYGPDEGLPGPVLGVGVDDGQNLYAIDGAVLYAAPAGSGRFVRTGSGGQLDLGDRPLCVCGGEAGKVYVGYLTWEAAPHELDEEGKRFGDLDRFALQPDGSLRLERHYRLQNDNARWMDHTRTILDCARVVGGPHHGLLYLGSNHGYTAIRGDEAADHRHAVFTDASGSLAIGYVWGVNVDVHGNALFASEWKVAALPPPGDDLRSWLDPVQTPWLVDTWVEVWGSLEEPDALRAIAGDLEAGRIWVGSATRGLAEMQLAPRRWTDIEDVPDRHVTDLELDPADGRLWVATASRGLWRYDPETGTWERNPHVPAGAVHDLLLDTTVEPRALYVATDTGLYALRIP